MIHLIPLAAGAVVAATGMAVADAFQNRRHVAKVIEDLRGEQLAKTERLEEHHAKVCEKRGFATIKEELKARRRARKLARKRVKQTAKYVLAAERTARYTEEGFIHEDNVFMLFILVNTIGPFAGYALGWFFPNFAIGFFLGTVAYEATRFVVKGFNRFVLPHIRTFLWECRNYAFYNGGPKPGPHPMFDLQAA